MKVMNVKMKLKIIGVILLVLLLVMLVSSLVVSYVTYNQNVDEVHNRIGAGAKTLKSKIADVQAGLARTVTQMNTVFKVGENVKFLGDFKQDYDLVMTEPPFMELTSALFATVSANDLDALALYDAKGELVTFTEIHGNDDQITGFYYVNPVNAFKFTRLKRKGNLENSKWDSQPAIAGLATPTRLEGLTGTTVRGRLGRSGNRLSLTLYVPVMATAYNKDTGKKEPVQVGAVILSRALGQDFAESLSDQTGLHINIFTGETFCAGTRPEYRQLDLSAVSSVALGDEGLADRHLITGMVENSGASFFQGLLPVYEDAKAVGAVALLSSSAKVMQNTLHVVYTMGVVYFCCMMLVVPVALFFAGSMVKPLLRVTTGLKDVAQGEGDLTRRIEVRSTDEIGELSQWFNSFVGRLQDMIREIASRSDVLSQSAAVTRKEVAGISDNADKMLEITRSVTQSTGEMNQGISSLSEVIGRSSDNLEMVASATGQMTSTINEIARRAETARAMSHETGDQFETAAANVKKLGEDAARIDVFTETINEISEQTNLLALNATIEAARAGEAGKGFAVVAGEIKALAAQTADATRDIKDRIDNIMAASDLTVRQMSDISRAFGSVNDVVNEIASAIEEQSVTTREISDNASSVASGIADVNASIIQFEGLTTEISGEMEAVNQACARMSDNCGRISDDAGRMEEQTGKLDQLINRFVVE